MSCPLIVSSGATGTVSGGYTRLSSSSSIDHSLLGVRSAFNRPDWIARRIVDLLVPDHWAASRRLNRCIAQRSKQALRFVVLTLVYPAPPHCAKAVARANNTHPLRRAIAAHFLVAPPQWCMVKVL